MMHRLLSAPPAAQGQHRWGERETMAKMAPTGDAARIIRQAVEEAARAAGVEVSRVVLFGSRARGRASARSDWDLLVVVRGPLTRPQRLSLYGRLSRALARRRLPGDFLIRTEAEVLREREATGSAVRAALQEGVVL